MEFDAIHIPKRPPSDRNIVGTVLVRMYPILTGSHVQSHFVIALIAFQHALPLASLVALSFLFHFQSISQCFISSNMDNATTKSLATKSVLHATCPPDLRRACRRCRMLISFRVDVHPITARSAPS